MAEPGKPFFLGSLSGGKAPRLKKTFDRPLHLGNTALGYILHSMER